MGLLGSSLAFLSACWSLASSTLPLFCSAFICSRKRSSRLAASPLSEVIASPSPRPELFRGGGSCAPTASRPASIVSRPLQQGHDRPRPRSGGRARAAAAEELGPG